MLVSRLLENLGCNLVGRLVFTASFMFRLPAPTAPARPRRLTTRFVVVLASAGTLTVRCWPAGVLISSLPPSDTVKGSTDSEHSKSAPYLV